MKGDFTRQTFRGRNHYRSVLVQQGRVQLDADFNEQALIQTHLDQVTGADTIGGHGAPEHDAGMAITDADGRPPHGTGGELLRISPGRYYVEGILCENEQPLPLDTQPDLPGVPLPAQDGTYAASLDVWLEHLTPLEQQSLLEVALGGVTTTTRARTVWQVRLRAAGTPPPPPSEGRLSARAQVPADGSPTPDGAVVTAKAYRRLENQLYRVEIHDPTGAVDPGGKPVGPTFVWSRENGSVAARLLRLDGNVLTVDTVGLDDRLSFAENPYPWVEVIDLARQRRGEHGYLGRIQRVDGTALTIAEWRGGVAPVQGDLGAGAVVRRWESQDAQPVSSADWIPLEDGVQIRFAAGGTFATGDYWLIPARTANLEGLPAIQGLTGNVDWPLDADGHPLFQPPEGIRHHHADLATLVRSEGGWTLASDDRNIFRPLTELAAQVDVRYAGGDGQRTVPGGDLPRPLEVSLTRASTPVVGASVRFVAADPDGRLATEAGGLAGSQASSLDAVTGADGLARCAWRPAADPARASQQVTARWVRRGVGPVDPPIDFFAGFDLASTTAFDPQGCVPLAGAVTVQDAVHRLAGAPSIRITAGQGQQSRAGTALPQPLQVEVRDGCGDPVPNATVRFSTPSGAVAVDDAGLTGAGPDVDVVTDANGEAVCRWKLGDQGPVQTLTATLQPATVPRLAAPSITFVAGVLAASPFATGLHVTGALLTGPVEPLTSDQQVEASALARGVSVLLDAPPDPSTVNDRPVLTVTLDLPFPFSGNDQTIWGTAVAGTTPLTVAGRVTVTDQAGSPAVTWTPTTDAAAFLNNLFAVLTTAQRGDHVLGHLTLSARSVAAADGRGVVNGLALTTTAPGLQLPTVDDVRGADFELRFWLVQSLVNLVLVPVRASRLALKSTTVAIALAISRDALRATLQPGVSVTTGPGQDVAAARRAVGWVSGIPQQVTLVVQDRYAAVAAAIRNDLAAVELTVEVVATADPAGVVTARRAAGEPVDGVLTDDAGLGAIAVLPDFAQEVPL